MDEILSRILDLCDKKNISERTTLIELGFSTSFFSEWKKGKIKSPSFDKIVKIADYFNVSIDYLVYGTEKYNDSCNNLTNEEIELLELYRKFDTKDKYKILGMLEMKSMLENENKKVTSSTSENQELNSEFIA